MSDDPIDDVIVKVARDLFGPRVSQAVRAGAEAARKGATPEEAELAASEAMRRQWAAEEAAAFDDAGHPDATALEHRQADETVPDGAQSAAPPSTTRSWTTAQQEEEPNGS